MDINKRSLIREMTILRSSEKIYKEKTTDLIETEISEYQFNTNEHSFKKKCICNLDNVATTLI